MLLKKEKSNNLRVNSVAKIDRIVTAKRADIIATLGKLNRIDVEIFKEKFKNLIDS